jgi:hypothetical protein
MQVSFTRERDTKNTVRFQEDGDADQHKIGALYVKKSAMAELGDPQALVVTIEKAS